MFSKKVHQPSTAPLSIINTFRLRVYGQWVLRVVCVPPHIIHMLPAETVDASSSKLLTEGLLRHMVTGAVIGVATDAGMRWSCALLPGWLALRPS